MFKRIGMHPWRHFSSKETGLFLSMVLKETKDGNHYDRYKKIALQGDEQMRHVHG